MAKDAPPGDIVAGHFRPNNISVECGDRPYPSYQGLSGTSGRWMRIGLHTFFCLPFSGEPGNYHVRLDGPSGT